MSALQIEFHTYQAQLPSMLDAHAGQYVVIKGSRLLNFFDSYEQALDWAYEAFGLDGFFVKQVAADQGIAHFTRDRGPCR